MRDKKEMLESTIRLETFRPVFDLMKRMFHDILKKTGRSGWTLPENNRKDDPELLYKAW